MKLGLDKDAAQKVEAVFKEEWKGYIPKARFDELAKEKDALQAAVDERAAQLEAMENPTGEIEGLKRQISDLQAANAEKDKAHAAEIRGLKINAAVEAALAVAKAKNVKAVRALLDLEKAELADDGTIKGLSGQIKKLQDAEDSKFLFDMQARKPSMKGAAPAETGVEEPDAKVDISRMTYEEIVAYMDANPDSKI